jgi:hypothetical protein
VGICQDLGGSRKAAKSWNRYARRIHTLYLDAVEMDTKWSGLAKRKESWIRSTIRNASGIASCRERGYRDQETVDEEDRAGQCVHGESQPISLPLGRHCEDLRFQVALDDSHPTQVLSHRH